MISYSPEALRGLLRTLVRSVFSEPVGDEAACAQQWREQRMLDVVDAFCDGGRRVPDGTMPWDIYHPK